MIAQNFDDRPISRFIAELPGERRAERGPGRVAGLGAGPGAEREFRVTDRLPAVGRATVALGGGADRGAGQVMPAMLLV